MLVPLQPPTKDEIKGLADLLMPLVKPIVDQWKRTNDTLDNTQRQILEIRLHAEENLRLYIILGSGSLGFVIGFMSCWFVFTHTLYRKVEHENALPSAGS